MDGHYYINLNAGKCVGCGMCESVCPIVNEIGVGTNELKASTPYKGWSNDDSYRARGTSGGVFGAIASTFIEQGGVVIGASLKDNECRHIAIDKKEDIRLIQGSKYMYSDMAGVYGLISSCISKGVKVLFSGLPCQVAGVLSYFRKNKNKHLIYTIDLVCGGMPSSLLLESFRKAHPKAEVVSFRSKEVYELRCAEDGKTINYGHRNILMNGFSSELTSRLSCYSCKYAHAHRCSDITLGDYWQAVKADSRGVSLMIVHNQRASDLLAMADIHKEEALWEAFLPYNPKIVVGRTPWEHRWERRLLPRLLNGRNVYLKNLIYASAYKKYDLPGIAYLAYKKCRSFIEHKRRLKEVETILLN